MLTLTHHFPSTYTKLLLQNWSTMTTLIHQKTQWVKDTIQPADSNPVAFQTLLTDQQIDDAWNGPMQVFFKTHCEYYARLARLRAALTIKKEELFKDTESAHTTFGLSPDKIDQIDLLKLSENQMQLNMLTEDHALQWDAFATQAVQEIITALQNNKITLTDLEKKELTDNQPVSELHDRLLNLNIEPPKLSKSAFNFEQYFTIKSALAIKNALARMQLPSNEPDITRALKQLQPALKKIHADEQALATQQSTALSQRFV